MKPIERDQRSGRSRYRTAPIAHLAQSMVGWDMVFQAEVLAIPERLAEAAGLRRCA